MNDISLNRLAESRKVRYPHCGVSEDARARLGSSSTTLDAATQPGMDSHPSADWNQPPDRVQLERSQQFTNLNTKGLGDAMPRVQPAVRRSRLDSDERSTADASALGQLIISPTTRRTLLRQFYAERREVGITRRIAHSTSEAKHRSRLSVDIFTNMKKPAP